MRKMKWQKSMLIKFFGNVTILYGSSCKSQIAQKSYPNSVYIMYLGA